MLAVLDDDQDLTISMCAYFESSGYDARPFYRTADCSRACKGNHYDAYVIDWIVGETNTRKLIAALRAGDVAVPDHRADGAGRVGHGRRGRDRGRCQAATTSCSRKAGPDVDPVGNARPGLRRGAVRAGLMTGSSLPVRPAGRDTACTSCRCRMGTDRCGRPSASPRRRARVVLLRAATPARGIRRPRSSSSDTLPSSFGCV